MRSRGRSEPLRPSVSTTDGSTGHLGGVAPPAPDLLTANIERIDDLGRVRFARVRIGDVKFNARVPAGFSIPGHQAGLKFDPSRVHVYADSRLVEGAA